MECEYGNSKSSGRSNWGMDLGVRTWKVDLRLPKVEGRIAYDRSWRCGLVYVCTVH